MTPNKLNKIKGASQGYCEKFFEKLDILSPALKLIYPSKTAHTKAEITFSILNFKAEYLVIPIPIGINVFIP